MRNPYKPKKIYSCANCKYWEKQEGQRYVGYCCRYPPLPQRANLGIISITNEDYWCGEYSPNNFARKKGY